MVQRCEVLGPRHRQTGTDVGGRHQLQDVHATAAGTWITLGKITQSDGGIFKEDSGNHLPSGNVTVCELEAMAH